MHFVVLVQVTHLITGKAHHGLVAIVWRPFFPVGKFKSINVNAIWLNIEPLAQGVNASDVAGINQ
jgi:hypothetical protein